MFFQKKISKEKKRTSNKGAISHKTLHEDYYAPIQFQWGGAFNSTIPPAPPVSQYTQ